MKEEFKVVGNISYSNDKYAVLINTNKHFYFLKINENETYEYPSLSKYIELCKCFYEHKYLDTTSKEGKISKAKKFLLAPKFIYGANIFIITYAIASLVATSCYKDLPVKYIENSIVTQSSSTVEIEEINDVYLTGINQTSSYLDENEVTWEQLIQNINNKTDLDQKYKDYLLEGATNLQLNMPDLNLDVLNYNIVNLKVYVEDRENFSNRFESEVLKKSAVGLFDQKTSSIYLCTTSYGDPIDEEFMKDIFFHEIFGHGTSTIDKNMVNSEGEYRLISGMELSANNIDSLHYLPGYNWTRNYLGTSLEEGAAELITMVALNKENKDSRSYRLEAQQLLMLMEITDLSLTELKNEGFVELTNKLIEYNINAYELYSNADLFQSMRRTEGEEITNEVLSTSNIKSVLYSYYYYLIDTGVIQELALAEIESIISNTSMGECAYKFPVLDSYNGEYAKDEILDDISNNLYTAEYTGGDLSCESLRKNNLKIANR